MTAQQGAAVVQPPLDRGDGEGKKVADARDRPLLEVEQEQDGAVLGLEGRQGVCEPFVFIVFLVRAGRVLARAPGSHRQFVTFGDQRAVYFGRLDGLRAVAFRADAGRPVPRDRVQPAGEFGRLAQLRQRLERDQKGVLGDVLGGPASRAQRLCGDQRHGPAEPADQLVERREVADQGGEHELLVGHFGVARAQVRVVVAESLRRAVHAVSLVPSPLKSPAYGERIGNR